MAFATSDTQIKNTAAGLLCEAVGTEVGASDVMAVDVHCNYGNMVRAEVIGKGGTATTYAPVIYWDVSADSDFLVSTWTATAQDPALSEDNQVFYTPTRKLYVKPVPDSGSDNTVLVRLFIGSRG